MPPPPDNRTAFIEPMAHTDRLAQLLEFEGITVGRFARQDLHELPAFGPDLLVLNQMRLRTSTFLTSASVVDACHVRPLTLAIVAQGDDMRGVELGERGLDGVLCGHIHTPVIKAVDGVLYMNCGDWVDSCSAIVERLDGSMQLVRHVPAVVVGDEEVTVLAESVAV